MAQQHEAALAGVEQEKQSLATERSEIAADQKAVDAGHVSDEPTKIADENHAAQEASRAQVDTHAQDLDAAHKEAATALADMHEYAHTGNEGHEGIEFNHYTGELTSGFETSQNALSESRGVEDEADYATGDRDGKDLPEHVHHPDELDGDKEDGSWSPEEHAKQLAEHHAYTAQVAAHTEEFQRRAGRAQTALEHLHEKQTAAIAGLKEAEKNSEAAQRKAQSALDKHDPDKHVEAAFSHHARDEVSGDFDDEDVGAAYDAARESADRIKERASERVENTETVDTGDSVEAIRESAKSVASAIKEIARHTKRPPRLPVKAPKPAKPKKSNRPGAAPDASVWGMAPRYKLKLHKLDFLSFVDEPAQQTAKIRLIKRAGANDRLRATVTARIAKVGEGADPLVYCWAFTCTDETGAPYHDLQGDAVSADDFLKAAEAFMADGGAVDEMHDGRQRSRIAFAFPMDAEIAAAMLGPDAGIAVKTSGLMVAIRPTPDQLVKIRSKEYTGVSIAGTGTRELVKAWARKPKGKKTGAAMAPYKRLSKLAALTSLVDGHQHSIDLSDPADQWWGERLSTSSQTADGAEQPHSHAWTYDPATGAITLGEDSGHTHAVEAVVPEDVLAEAIEDDERKCPGCGAECDEDARYCPMCGKGLAGEATCTPVTDEKSGSTPTVVVVRASARAGISTPTGGAPTVKGTSQENPPMDPKISKLLATALLLPEAQRAHVAKLAPDDQAAFLALDGAGRDGVVKAARDADPVVYTTKAGLEIRKSAGDLAAELAKRADAQEEQLAKQAEQLAKAESSAALAGFEKRAGVDLSHFAKSLGARAAIVRAVDGIADEALRKEAHEALKGANAAMVSLGKSTGISEGEPSSTDDTPVAKFNAELAAFAKAGSKTPERATSDFLRTERGADLYAAAYPLTRQA